MWLLALLSTGLVAGTSNGANLGTGGSGTRMYRRIGIVAIKAIRMTIAIGIVYSRVTDNVWIAAVGYRINTGTVITSRPSGGIIIVTILSSWMTIAIAVFRGNFAQFGVSNTLDIGVIDTA